MLLEVGTIVEGKVTGISKFGAFVSLPGGKSGMVHISEVANAYVSDIHEYISDGQVVKVKVIGFTPDGKINLSIKKAQEPTENERRPQERRPMQDNRRPPREDNSAGAYRQVMPEMQPEPRTRDASFEDKLKQFMIESDSKISGSRIYDQQRRTSRRRRN